MAPDGSMPAAFAKAPLLYFMYAATDTGFNAGFRLPLLSETFPPPSVFFLPKAEVGMIRFGKAADMPEIMDIWRESFGDAQEEIAEFFRSEASLFIKHGELSVRRH